MKKIKMLSPLTLIIFFLTVVVFAYFLITSGSITGQTKTSQVKIGKKTITVEVVSSPIDMAKGLSGRESLPENTGMLFVWNRKLKPAFWMPDMNFAIDIIWISDSKIVGIEKQVNPEPGVLLPNLKKYYPPELVNYVLEVPAGFSDKNNIKAGDTVKLKLI